MDTGGEFALCESCGMKHTKDRLEAKAHESGAQADSNLTDIDSLMQRGWASLENSEWKAADVLFEKVLKINAEHALAYIGKLCASLSIMQKDELVDYDIAANKDYQKALRFADANYHAILAGYNLTEEERIDKKLDKLRQYIATRPKTQRELDYEKAIIKYEEERKNQKETKRAYKELVAKQEADIGIKQEQYQEAMAQYQAALNSNQEEARRRKEQSDNWKNQGLCAHCGGKMGVFGSCRVCRYPASTPVQIDVPYINPPKAPQVPPTIQMDIPKLTPPTPPAIRLADIPGTVIRFCEHNWKVLDIHDGKALFLCESVIEKRPYNKDNETITWKTCDLRDYLNGVFFNKLSTSLKKMIAETRLENNKNQWFGTSGGNTTADKVFLLSIDEVVKYFGDGGQLSSKNREGGRRKEDKNCSTSVARDEAGTVSWWWLRSPGVDANRAANVHCDGTLSIYGFRVDVSDGGVRPALWLKL